MKEQDLEFQKMLLQTFKIEAEEHIAVLASGLVALENTPESEQTPEVMEEVFRAAHSLKGAARAVNETEIETLCHNIESIFSSLQHHEREASTALFDEIHETVDAIQQLIQSMDTHESREQKTIKEDLLARLEHCELQPKQQASDTMQSPQETVKKEPILNTEQRHSDTVRISAEKLDKLLLQAEELLSVKVIASECASSINALMESLGKHEKKHALPSDSIAVLHSALSKEQGIPDAVKVAIQTVLKNKTQETVFLKSFQKNVESVAKKAEHSLHVLSSIVNRLLSEMKNVLMMPIDTTLRLCPKLVRDIARIEEKKVEVVIRGGEIEVDRRILEAMIDPITHLIRNSIGHGIESPEVRKSKNKPEQGTLTIAITQKDGGFIELTLSDDGAGIDLEKTKEQARKLGLITPEECKTLDGERVLPFIFKSGISTSTEITELSGRGLGLAIVWEKIEKLGGSLRVTTEKDRGTTFYCTLPVTVATFRGVYVRLNAQLYLIPTGHIAQCLRIPVHLIQTTENAQSILWEGKRIAITSLATPLEIPNTPVRQDSESMISVVIVSAHGMNIAFCVDEILGEDDILFKNFNKQLARVRNIAGATILGNGQVVPVLQVHDLVRSIVGKSNASAMHPMVDKSDLEEKKSILVVDDSITSRMLLKNVLESSGYWVTTANDGMDAFRRAKTSSFDLIVSDVMMPGMNGFELTEKMRSDGEHAQIPIILITSLESDEEKHHGMEVGASAYIIKSQFDKTNLLEVVRRLI